jgi:CRISPR-associated protein Cmr1
LKSPPAIADQQSAELVLGYPTEMASMLKNTVQLLHWFGTVGGRSRNGWGSFALEGEGLKGFDNLKSSDPLIEELSRPLDKCLQVDWPHAIGRDAKSVLIWKSKDSYGSWADVVKELAEAKIQFRTALPFIGRKGDLQDRHVLAYPVTKHDVNGWKKGRLANQVRFKIARQNGRYFGIVYHLPCRLPQALCEEYKGNQKALDSILAKQEAIWERVHRSLQENNSFERI